MKFVNEENGSEISFSDNLLVILFLIAFGWITHYEFISKELLNPDAVWNKELFFSSSWEIALGRWLLPVVDILHGGVNSYPLMATLAFVFYAIAGIYFCKIFKINDLKWKILISCVIVSSPLVAEILTYCYCAEAYSLSFMIAVLSVYLVNSDKIILAIVFLVTSLALYQSNIGVVAFLCLAILFIKSIENCSISNIGNTIKKFSIFGFSGIAIYYGIYKILMLIYKIEPVAYKNAGEIGIGNIIRRIPNSIINAYSDFYKYFFKNSIMINSFGVKYLNIIIVIAFALMFIFFIKNRNISKYNMFLSFGIIAVTPIFCNAINLLAPDTTIILLTSSGMLVVIPFVFVMLFTYFSFNMKKTSIKIFEILIAFFIWGNILITVADAKLMTINQEKTIWLGDRIYSSICAEVGYTSEQKLLIAGRPNCNNYNTTIDTNYYVSDLLYVTNYYANWGMIWEDFNVNTILWDSIFKVYYGLELNWCTTDEYRVIASTKEFEEMPIYPNEGSIEVINDILVVKVS